MSRSLTRLSYQCIEDITERFDEAGQERLLQLVKEHLGAEDAATAATKQAEEERIVAAAMEVDEPAQQEIDEREAEALMDDNALIDEGYAGRADQYENDIDETAEPAE